MSKKKAFGIKALLFALIILNFNVAGAFASEKHEITPETMLELTNGSRREVGADELKLNEKLESAALAKASDMFEFQYFDHNSPSGTTPWHWIRSAGYEYSYAGENLAIDFISAEGTHQAFMNSASHRENILNNNYKEIGIAVKKGMFKGEETIIVVVEFGAKSEVKVTASSVPEIEPKKPIEVKNYNIIAKENDRISLGPISNVEAEKIEEIIFEDQAVIDEYAGKEIADILTFKSEFEKMEPKNNLFVDSLYHPDKNFQEAGICLGARKKETDQKEPKNVIASRVIREKLLADHSFARKYDNLVSSLGSFENEIILFLLSATMTMNLVFISSGNIQEDDG